jgi:hypothetical protein
MFGALNELFGVSLEFFCTENVNKKKKTLLSLTGRARGLDPLRTHARSASRP